MSKTARYEVVSGTRVAPGAVLATFPVAGVVYRCGGPATACLRWFDKAQRKAGAAPMFFRKVS